MPTPLREALSTREADALLQTAFTKIQAKFPPPAETVSLGSAGGRVLAEDVLADRDMPPFDRVMMDGFICHAQDLAFDATPRPLTVLPQALLAGTDPGVCTLPEPGQCLAVATGAAWPTGACRNTWRIIPIEKFESSDLTESAVAAHRPTPGSSGRTMMLSAAPKLKTHSGQHLHLQGSDCKAGTHLLGAGSVLGPIELTICATVGQTQPLCRRRQRVQILTTGSELVLPDALPRPHQIRASHPAMLHPVLAPWAESSENIVHVPDHPADLRTALKRAAETADVVLLTGGVSRGQEDFTRPTLEQMGAHILLHRVHQRPGFPFLCARLGSSIIFGLPGNPLSVLCCTARYVVPWLKAASMGFWPAHDLLRLPASTFASAAPPADQSSRYVALKRELKPSRSGAPLREQKIQNQLVEWIVVSAQNSGDFVSWAGAEGVVELTGELIQPDEDGMLLLPWYPFGSTNGFC